MRTAKKKENEIKKGEKKKTWKYCGGSNLTRKKPSILDGKLKQRTENFTEFFLC